MDSAIDHGPDTECYWMERPDGWWVDVEGLDPRAMARLMVGREARWVTMTGAPLADGAHRLIYRWEVSGRPLNIATTIADAPIDSIADLLPAAAPAEREMHHRFAIAFVGNAETAAPPARPRVA